MGAMEGHLKIVSLKEVELADAGATKKVEGNKYTDYPLLIRSQGNQKEIARIIADSDGNYRTKLPAGDYVLQVDKSVARHARAAPQRFTIRSNQTVHVDLAVDTGVR